jgi:hypothetical protein
VGGISDPHAVFIAIGDGMKIRMTIKLLGLCIFINYYKNLLINIHLLITIDGKTSTVEL